MGGGGSGSGGSVNVKGLTDWGGHKRAGGGHGGGWVLDEINWVGVGVNNVP